MLYFCAAAIYQIISEGGPGSLNLLVLLFAWNALKMLWVGPLSVAILERDDAPLGGNTPWQGIGLRLSHMKCDV